MREDDKVARRKRANEVRLSAIREKSRKTESLQSQIKKSIQRLDESVKKATHIQFSDSEDEVDQEVFENGNIKLENSPNCKADTILGFSGTDSEDEININLKPQFEGKEGEKLLQIQSSYGNDTRFRLDRRFAESTLSDDDKEAGEIKEGREKYAESEVVKNLHLLSQVMGHDVTSADQTKKKVDKFIDVSARRYDPTRDTHLELKVEKSVEIKPKRKKKKDENERIVTDSKKYFEMSTDVLRNAFASKRGETTDTTGKEDQPFSFLAMLGRPEDHNDQDNASKNQQQDVEATDPHLDLPRRKQIPTLEEKFHYESSETEEEEEMGSENETDHKPEKTESKIGRPPKSDGCSSFFPASKHDPRIVDGVKEFCWNKPFEQIQQEWLEVKDTLIKDYKKKHRDAKRKQRKAKYEARILSVHGDT